MLKITELTKTYPSGVRALLSIGLFYLFGQGHNHWSYNLVLYELWTPADLTGPGFMRLLALRVYAMALAAAFLLLVHVCFQRSDQRA